MNDEDAFGTDGAWSRGDKAVALLPYREAFDTYILGVF